MNNHAIILIGDKRNTKTVIKFLENKKYKKLSSNVKNIELEIKKLLDKNKNIVIEEWVYDKNKINFIVQTLKNIENLEIYCFHLNSKPTLSGIKNIPLGKGKFSSKKIGGDIISHIAFNNYMKIKEMHNPYI
jgi:hypothetical protein